MPSGAVDDHGGVDIVGQGVGELVEEQLHRGCVDTGEHEGEILATGGAHGGEDVGPLVADLPRPSWSLAAMPPAMTDPPFVADTGLVLEPELDALLWMRRLDALQAVAEPPFLKLSSASGSFSGCAGRIFCRDMFKPRSTRPIEAGW